MKTAQNLREIRLYLSNSYQPYYPHKYSLLLEMTLKPVMVGWYFSRQLFGQIPHSVTETGNGKYDIAWSTEK